MTLMRWDVLSGFLEFSSSKRFLEIGVQLGHVSRRVPASEKWGVDPHPQRNAEAKYHRFYRGTSDDFFALLSRDELFDVILVDGLHHADQVLRDVENSLRHLAPGGVIVMHDCSPGTELAQRVPRETGVWNGDCWKAMVELRKRDDLDAFTIDSDHGIGVVRKLPNPSPLRAVPESLTYAHLEADRENLLGLVPARAWTDRVGPPLALGRVVVVTAIFGGRDVPIPAPRNDVDEYVMFTDGPGADGWRVVRQDAGEDPRLAARQVKTLALELVHGDVVVWVDGRIEVTALPLKPLLRQALRDTVVAGFPHPWRARVAEEARECGDLGLAPKAALQAQLEAYQAAGFADDAGLWNTMVLARRHSPEARALGRAWWDEIQRHTVRDQVSLPYLLWRDRLSCGRLGDDVYREGSSKHFIRGRHRRAA